MIIPSTQMTNTSPFLQNGSSKNQFLKIYLTNFLSEAVEARRCKCFENWLMKHKCPNLLKPLGTIDQKKHWSFYPSEPFSFDPVVHKGDSYSAQLDTIAHICTCRYVSPKIAKKSDILNDPTFPSVKNLFSNSDLQNL